MGVEYYARSWFGFVPSADERVNERLLGAREYDGILRSLGVCLIRLPRGGYAVAIDESATQAQFYEGPQRVGGGIPSPDWQDRLRKAAYALGLFERPGAWWIDLYADV